MAVKTNINGVLTSRPGVLKDKTLPGVFKSNTIQPIIVDWDSDVLDFLNKQELFLQQLSLEFKIGINTFVKNAKLNGYWEHLIEVNPFLGSSIEGAFIKLKFNTEPFIINSDLSEDQFNFEGFTSTLNNNVLFTNYSPSNREFYGLSVFLKNGGIVDFGIRNTNRDLQIDIRQINSQITGDSNNLLVTEFDFNKFDRFLVHSFVNLQQNKNKIFINGTNKQELDIVPDVIVDLEPKLQFNFFQDGITTTIMFYAIDDGQFTDQQAIDYNRDLQTLMSDLNRNILPPIGTSQLIDGVQYLTLNLADV